METNVEEITIRKCTVEDLTMVYDLENEAFKNHSYPFFFFRQACDVFKDFFQVALNDMGNVLGYTLGTLQSKSDEGWILGLAVKKDFQHRGIASMLTETILQLFWEKGAKYCLLTVEPSNISALNLYIKTGFLEIKREHDYFGIGKPRIVMRKTLDKLYKGN
ncbi:GNAT family N-acetyltransferase [Candidatus Magnetomoraceae bacterium gMMP-13]